MEEVRNRANFGDAGVRRSSGFLQFVGDGRWQIFALKPSSVERHADRGEILAGAVVEFAGDATSLVVLNAEQTD